MQPAIVSHGDFNSLISIKPLVEVLRKMIAEGKPGAKKLYENLLQEIDLKPGILEAMDNTSTLFHNADVVETLLSGIFPPSTSANQGIYAISFPFRLETIYASPGFKEIFLPTNSNVITVPDNKTTSAITRATHDLAYNVILNKIYSLDVPEVAYSVHPFVNPETGLTKYLRLKLNAQFVEVKLINENFELPPASAVQLFLNVEELKKTFPLQNFQFEGLVVIDVTDVTTEQVIQEMKNTLLDGDAFYDITVYDSLQQHIRTFLELKDVSIGITPFFKLGDYFLFSDGHYKNSVLFRDLKVTPEKIEMSKLCKKIFKETDGAQLYDELNENNLSQNELVSYYHKHGAKSLILCPLKGDDGELIGLVEILSDQPGKLQYTHLTKIQSAMHLFTLALEKSIESMELQIDKTIKENFTAVQPAVEWKFTEAAFKYLEQKQVSDTAKIPSITFHDVYPLYAEVDVKNSSVERNHAIQLDLLEQLNMVHTILEKASRIIAFPLLKEIKFKAEKYISSTTENLLSDDELLVYDFLHHDLNSLFGHLINTKPELKKLIDEYYASLDPQKQIIFHHRKEYEESITMINDTLDRFIDQEQEVMQQIFPHFFERYVTDGIEFNIYIGQSLAPHFKFDEIYVSNLKMWQLTLLAKAARITHGLEKSLSIPLQTTQLILAHNIPLSITFRIKERKFDVDGAYNIRYEIIKKRIDKVHIKGTGERLTQPGKIAIVYSQQKEQNEYLEFVEYLQNENLIVGNVEHLELEELQGISGLKALRLQVNLHTQNEPTNVELSTLTTQQLLNN
ncbi:MAG: hypothetical protein ABR502_01355 [Chitinophagaceae bacterium]